MSFAKASVWTAASTLVKIGAGLLIIKLLAVVYGPEGVGLAGNFRQLITVLGVLAGGGIFNGVIRAISRHHAEPEQLTRIIGTSSSIILIFSVCLAVLFVTFSAPVSSLLFHSSDYQRLIIQVALVQMAIAWANFALAIMKGFRDAVGNAYAVIIGSVLGVGACYVCVIVAGYHGALLGLALFPAIVVIPATVLLLRRTPVLLRAFHLRFDVALASQLLRFTVMALITAVTLPVAYILMRDFLAKQDGWSAVGLWQGVSTISDAYLQFITASFSVYLLPTLARATQKHQVSHEILRALRFVLPAVALASLSVWLLRDWVISLLFSGQFSGMRELFAWQLTGDVLKVGSYVFGYLVIARGSLRFYLLAEVCQFILLIGFSRWLIPLHGALGATQAYMATYMVYFTLCCGLFFLYHRRS